MFSIEKYLEGLEKRRPKLFAVLCFVAVSAILLALLWFLLFSGLNTSADFVYNQF